MPNTRGYGVHSIPSSSDSVNRTAQAQCRREALPMIARYITPKVAPWSNRFSVQPLQNSRSLVITVDSFLSHGRASCDNFGFPIRFVPSPRLVRELAKLG